MLFLTESFNAIYHFLVNELKSLFVIVLDLTLNHVKPNPVTAGQCIFAGTSCDNKFSLLLIVIYHDYINVYLFSCGSSWLTTQA